MFSTLFNIYYNIIISIMTYRRYKGFISFETNFS